MIEIVRGQVAQREEPQFLENAVELLEQVTLAAEHTISGQIHPFLPQFAAQLEGGERVAPGVAVHESVQRREQCILVIPAQLPGKIGHRAAGQRFGRTGLKRGITGQDFPKVADTAFEILFRPGRP